MASEMESIANSGSEMPMSEKYQLMIGLIAGQIAYFNDTLANGYTTDISVETKNGFVEQSISVLIPYLKEDECSKTVSHTTYEFKNSHEIPYGETVDSLSSILPDEKDPRWF
jgi:hypothetical protein